MLKSASDSDWPPLWTAQVHAKQMHKPIIRGIEKPFNEALHTGFDRPSSIIRIVTQTNTCGLEALFETPNGVIDVSGWRWQETEAGGWRRRVLKPRQRS
jgi:hypothetical protein